MVQRACALAAAAAAADRWQLLDVLAIDSETSLIQQGRQFRSAKGTGHSERARYCMEIDVGGGIDTA